MTKKKLKLSNKQRTAADNMEHGRSELIAIVNDIHFDLHDTPTWNAFRSWHAEHRPSKTVILGDFLDLGMMSNYVQGASDPLFAIPQIKCFVTEANALVKECGELVVVEGNHDERWSKLVLGKTPHIYKDAIGLSLHDQCLNQGLDPNITWIREDTVVKGLQCGPFILRHGHNQQARFGHGKHLAATRVAKTLGQSEVFGHYHRAQMYCQTAMGKTAIAIASPCMTKNHDYNKDPDWQRGFVILELYGPDNTYATPYLIVMENGHFAYHGKVYSGV